MPYTYRDIRLMLVNVSCKPFEIKTSCVQCLHAGESESSIYHREELKGLYNCTEPTHTWYLQACLWRQDTYTRKMGWGESSKYILSGDMHEGEIVKKAFVACRDYAEHEVREAFEYKGVRILGPHIPLDALWEAGKGIE